MHQPEYNSEEKGLIEAVHSAFPKIELDTNVAIGQVNFDGSQYTYHSVEAEQFEAFFRGVFWPELMALGEQDNSFFYPANYQPIPWWQIQLDEMLGGLHFDDIFRMTPYGKYYYLPYILLLQIHRLNILRCGQEKNSRCMADDLWHSLVVPEKIASDCWAEIDSLPPEYRDPLNKKDTFKMMEKEGQEFMVFLSFFNEAQKRAVSNIIQYGSNISFELVYERDFADENEMLERLKSVWSLC